MKESLYSRRSNLVVGFHGCDKSVVDAVIAGKTELLASTNDYDWLGSGIYFWENNEDRAWQWAKQLSTRKSSNVKEPAVIGGPALPLSVTSLQSMSKRRATTGPGFPVSMMAQAPENFCIRSRISGFAPWALARARWASMFSRDG